MVVGIHTRMAVDCGLAAFSRSFVDGVYSRISPRLATVAQHREVSGASQQERLSRAQLSPVEPGKAKATHPESSSPA